MSVINTATPQSTFQWIFIETEVDGWASSGVPPPVVCVHTPCTLQVVHA